MSDNTPLSPEEKHAAVANLKKQFETALANSGRRFVNAYAVWRLYGGPEEGGWWYDSGEFLRGIEVHTVDEIEKAKAELWAEFGPSYGYDDKGRPTTRRRDRFSVAGGADIEIYIEEGPGHDYPDRRPVYE